MYQRVFILLQQCTWQLYHTESLNLMEHPMTAVVLRTAIQETHCVTYIFTFMTTLHTLGVGDVIHTTFRLLQTVHGL